MSMKKTSFYSLLSTLPLLVVGACGRYKDRDISDPVSPPPPAQLDLFKADSVAPISLVTPSLIDRCTDLFAGYNQDKGREIAFEYYGPKGEKRPFKSTVIFNSDLCVSGTNKISVYLQSKEERPTVFIFTLDLQADKSMTLVDETNTCDPVEVLKFRAEIQKEYKGSVPFDSVKLDEFATDQICSRYKNAVKQSLMDVSKELR